MGKLGGDEERSVASDGRRRFIGGNGSGCEKRHGLGTSEQ